MGLLFFLSKTLHSQYTVKCVFGEMGQSFSEMERQ